MNLDEIAPRSVKVGRRRPSQRQSGGDELVRSEERFGLEIQQENIDVYLQVHLYIEGFEARNPLPVAFSTTLFVFTNGLFLLVKYVT